MGVGWSTVALALLLLPAMTAAENHVVTALPNLTFSPRDLSIAAGDTVTFQNGGGLHNAVSDPGAVTAFRCANGCDGAGGNGNLSGAAWSATVTFPTAGTIGYTCEAHGSPGGFGMAGTITVTAVEATPARRSDIDGDGKSDIAWFHPGAQKLAYWVMNGALIARGSGELATDDTRALMTGDFDGNGRADILARGTGGDLRIWFGDGTGFTMAPVSLYPTGWVVAGSDDIDGDHKSDIMWFHPGARKLAYWVMNGALITRSSGELATDDAKALATGDFDGNGRADVLAVGTGGDLRIWFGDGTNFTMAPVSLYPAGWVVVGSDDIDGDQKSDIAWFHPVARKLAYWVMNGALIARSSGELATDDARALVTGDFDGNGRADVLTRGTGGDLRIWLGDGTNFILAPVGPYPAGWEVVTDRDRGLRAGGSKPAGAPHAPLPIPQPKQP